MKLFTNLKFAAAAFGLMFMFCQAPATVLAQAPPPDNSLFKNSKSEACAGAQLEPSAATSACTEPAQSGFNKLLGTVINIFSVIIAIIAVIMIMISGMRYITSGGDSNSVTSAKNGLLYAVIGLVIVAMAQFIVKFVLNKVTS